MEKLYKQSLIIKIIAVITMIIDHVGALFFPQILLLRIIGRLSFPLFGWLVAEGFDKTHDKKKYLFRMFCFFLISQIPYYLTFHDGQLNIFLTLSVGLSTIWILTEKKLELFFKVLFTACLLFIAFILPINYGLTGVISIISFYFLKNSPWKLSITQIIIWSVYIGFSVLNGLVDNNLINYKNEIIQLVAVLAIPIIYLIKKHVITTEYFLISRTKKFLIQYGFYMFYPVHLLLLFVLTLLIQ